MKRIELDVDGVVAEADLMESTSPKAVEAFWDSLPVERTLITAKWSGDVVAFHPKLPALEGIDTLESPVTSIYPGAIVMRPRGTEILIGFGVGEYRWAIGVDYTTRLAQVTTNRAAFLAAVAAVHDKGSANIQIRRKEDS